jgi:hypothetical protein
VRGVLAAVMGVKVAEKTLTYYALRSPPQPNHSHPKAGEEHWKVSIIRLDMGGSSPVRAQVMKQWLSG